MPKYITVKDIVDAGMIDVPCKVTFRQNDPRFAMIGKFVMLEGDGENLEKKGMIRFVDQKRMDIFEASPDIMKSLHTKIFAPSSFGCIRQMSAPRILYAD